MSGQRPLTRGVASILLATLLFAGVAGANAVPAEAQVPDAGIDVAMLPSEQALRSWQVRDLQPPEQSTLGDFDVLVWDFVEIDGIMYVGGRFQTVRRGSGATEHNQPFLAAFDVASGDWVSSFRPVLDDGVYSLEATSDGRLLVGGEFTSVNGVPGTSGIAALDPITGAPDPAWVTSVSRDGGDHIVTEIVVASDSIYIAGRFNRMNKTDGTSGRKYNLARLHPVTGATDWSFEVPVSGGRVMAMGLSPDERELYLGGFFSSVGLTPNTRWMAMVRTGNGEVVAMADPIPQDLSRFWVFDLTVTETKVWVAIERHFLYVYDQGDLSREKAFHTAGYGGDPQAVHYHDGVVWAGGHFHGWERDWSDWPDNTQPISSWYRQVNWLTAYNAETTAPVEDWVARMGATDGVWALEVDSEGKLWAGGDPTSSGTVPVSGFAVYPNRTDTDEINLARGATTAQSSNGESGFTWAPPDRVGVSPESRCNLDGFALIGPSEAAVDGKTNGGPWECSFSATAAENNPWWQVDLGSVSEIDALRVWNLYSTPAANDLADVWVAVSNDAGAISSNDPAVLIADPAVAVVKIDGRVPWFHEQPIGLWGRYVRLLLDSDAPTQLRLAEVEVLDIPGVSPPPVVDPDRELVSRSAMWRFWDQGTMPGSDWAEVNFDDAGWDSGPALVGFGDADVVTTTQSGVLTTYLRHEFDVANPAAIAGLSLELLADDGAVVYLNGAEIHRLRMPAGPVTENTYASESVWGAAERAWTSVEVPPNMLVPGANVLAIEVHNDWRRGGDLAFDASLTAIDDVVEPPAEDQLLVAFQSAWRYDDAGTLRNGTAWRQPDFNDAGWSIGEGQFGYGDGDEATVISEGPVPDRHISYYFRGSFDVSDPAEIGELQISLIRDDGAVVYINGLEVVRSNMADGTVTAETLASAYAWGTDERDPHVFTLGSDMLMAGTNTVAVEVHSADQGSRDLSFDLELLGLAG